MGLAIDTIVGYAANPGSSGAAPTMNTGDSLTIRAFASPATATLFAVVRDGTTGGFIQLRSPLFHDDVRGIRFTSDQAPASFMMPPEAGQGLRSTDTLIALLSGGTAETDVFAASIFYSDLSGAAARLHMWGDIKGNIKYIKPVEVDVTNSATAGEWTDTVITTTEDLLHADSDYAVLGMVTDTAQTVMAVKGGETGNLRVSIPGQVRTDDTSDYFVQLSNKHGLPMIPVFNANNRASVYVSTADATASTTPKVQLILAELITPLAS